MMNKLTHQSVVIADDHDLIRHALETVLVQASNRHGIDYELVGTASNGHGLQQRRAIQALQYVELGYGTPTLLADPHHALARLQMIFN